LSYFRHAGVDGVEFYWYNNDFKTARFNEQLRALARPQGFFFTYGSDCHGPGSGKHTIMKFKGCFEGFPPPTMQGMSSSNSSKTKQPLRIEGSEDIPEQKSNAL